MAATSAAMARPSGRILHLPRVGLQFAQVRGACGDALDRHRERPLPQKRRMGAASPWLRAASAAAVRSASNAATRVGVICAKAARRSSVVVWG
ncbi:hypothetical protein ACWDHW_44705 [Streptomyces melanosporofaciens]